MLHLGLGVEDRALGLFTIKLDAQVIFSIIYIFVFTQTTITIGGVLMKACRIFLLGIYNCLYFAFRNELPLVFFQVPFILSESVHSVVILPIISSNTLTRSNRLNSTF